MRRSERFLTDGRDRLNGSCVGLKPMGRKCFVIIQAVCGTIRPITMRLERAVFPGICGEIFALFQACVGNFNTIQSWKFVGTLHLDSSCVTFIYFAFLNVCDRFELLGHVQAAMMT